ncbi:PAS domain S-box protein [Geovibrio thiophilus]|uniref:histidine kinase n=1 Tax=Geovibrio thiophilus TaxID=139438 RepID=A0A410JV43_9BACT|nr:PAS domain S-box protein [Geovibrio thiophilus]QAR32054.1 PAS domain S-box protein [Geovibrio thiophilus]
MNIKPSPADKNKLLSVKAAEFYKSLSRAAAGACDEGELLDALCRLSAELMGYEAAWAGFIVEFTDKRIIPSSYSGEYEDYINPHEICICCNDPNCGPVGEAVIKEHEVAVNDISAMEDFSFWQYKTLECGINSFCSIPVKTGGKVTAVFTVLSREKNRFCPEEISLLKEITEETAACMSAVSARSRIIGAESGNKDLIEKFGVLFNNTSDAIFVHEMPEDNVLSGRFIEVNKSASEKLGYTQEEFMSLSPEILNYPCGKFDMGETSKILLKTGHAHIEALIKCKSGALLPVRISCHTFSMGKNKYIVSIVRDITEKIRTIKQLNLLKNAIEHSTVSVVITDKDGSIEYVNPVFEKFTGYSADEVVGQNPRILKSDKMDPKVFIDLWAMISGGRIWKGEFCNKKKSGELYWESAIIFPVKDQSGEIVNYIGLKEDITDKKILEEQVRHAQRLNIIGEMAGSFAHDLKNIILVIGGFANRLQKKLDEKSPEHEYVVHIMKAVTRAAKLTNGLLTFGRKQPNHPECLEMNILLREYVDLIEKIVDEHVSVVLHLSEEHMPVMADYIQLEQVLMNLASNAKDAMPDGGTLTITSFIKECAEGKFACILFEDTGCGMSPEIKNRIFDPFYTTKDPGKGTGLGLSIVYGIIRQHGGGISCTSEEGKGTVFEICLPLSTPYQA